MIKIKKIWGVRVGGKEVGVIIGSVGVRGEVGVIGRSSQVWFLYFVFY